MSFLNSTLLNGDIFEAGTGSVMFAAPVGSVLVEGTVGISLMVGHTSTTHCRATTNVRIGRKISLASSVNASALNASEAFTTSIKLMRSDQSAAAQTDATLSLKQFIGSTTEARCSTSARTRFVRQVRGEAVCRAICASDTASRIGLSSATPATAETSAKMIKQIGMVSATPCTAQTDTHLHTALVISMVSDTPCRADTETQLHTALVIKMVSDTPVRSTAYAIPSRLLAMKSVTPAVAVGSAVWSGRKNFGSVSTVKALTSSEAVLKRGMFSATNAQAQTQTNITVFSAAALTSTVSAQAVGSVTMSMKTQRFLTSTTNAQAVCAASNMVIKADLGKAGTTCRAYCYANLEERDTRPAPPERTMIVPFEDRRMMVY